jgi:2-polyprenyl-3-methyl-5-hydroxy-6-metoxy-1,4-benzoquinol methylase
MATPHVQPPQGPDAIMQMLQAAQVTAILASSIELGLFAKLAEGEGTADAIASRIGCPPRSTRVLLNALSVVGLVAKQGVTYALTPLSSEHLVPGKPMYLGDAASLFASPMSWEGRARFADVVKNDGTVLAEHAETPKNAFWETFAKSSAFMSFPAVAVLDGVLAPWFAARPKVRVLDIACGSGIYGYTLAKRANVELTLLDWPNVLVETKKWAPRLGVNVARARYIEGSFFDVDFQGPYDLILLSNVYHHFDPPTCRSLTRKVAAALAPGGRVAVQDLVTDGDAPAATMFSTIMLMWTRKGESYATGDYKGWFAEAGLGAPEVHPSQGLPSVWMLADKK